MNMISASPAIDRMVARARVNSRRAEGTAAATVLVADTAAVEEVEPAAGMGGGARPQAPANDAGGFTQRGDAHVDPAGDDFGGGGGYVGNDSDIPF